MCEGVGLGAGVVGGGFSVGVGVGAGADDEVLDGVGAGALLLAELPPLPGVELALGDWLVVWWFPAPCLREALALADAEGLGLTLGLADGVVDVAAAVAVDVAE